MTLRTNIRYLQRINTEKRHLDIIAEFIANSRSIYLKILIPLLIIETIYFIVVFYKHGFATLNSALWIAICNKLFVDACFYLLIIIALQKLFPWRVIPVGISALYMLLVAGNVAVYFFGNTRLERHHFDLITWYSLKSFADVNVIVLLLTIAFLLILSWFFMKNIGVAAKWSDFMIFTLIAALLYISDIPRYMYENNQQENYRLSELAGYLSKCQNQQIQYATEYLLAAFYKDVIRGIGSDVYKVSHGSAWLSEIVEKFSLSLGKREYRSLNLRPFKKIVVFASESISLDLLGRYNKGVGFDNAPFYNSNRVFKNMFANYYTSASPTLYSLLVMFNSHPNYHLLLQKKYQNSLVRRLRGRGYKTIFLRSCSKFYANENVYLKDNGFEEIIAREDFEEHKESRKYIEGWGVFDRVLYERLIELLEEYKNEKLFVTVLGVDTHPPVGRVKRKDLRYPMLPELLREGGSVAAYLRSIFYHDYDIKYIVDKIEDKDLLTNDTLLVFTADHACPFNNVLKQVSKYPQDNLARIPLAFISGQELPQINNNMVLSSQIDFAPTLFHLLGLEIPRGWWGESLFFDEKKDLSIGFNRNIIHFKSQKDAFRIDVTSKKLNETEQDFVYLFNTIIVN